MGERGAMGEQHSGDRRSWFKGPEARMSLVGLQSRKASRAEALRTDVQRAEARSPGLRRAGRAAMSLQGKQGTACCAVDNLSPSHHMAEDSL